MPSLPSEHYLTAGEPMGGERKILRLTLTNREEEIARVKEEFETFASEHGVSSADRQRFALVFDELLSNIIFYAFDDSEEHEISVVVEVAGKRLVVAISDDGKPFNPFAHETPDTSASVEDREIGGLGIHIVKNVMDEATYDRRAERNLVTVAKLIDRTP